MLLLTSCSNYSRDHLHLSCGSATIAQVIQEHDEEFLNEMNCKVIASKLKAMQLIPESVKNDIVHSGSKELANTYLLNYLKEDADEETVRKVFKVASDDATYGRMKAFVTRMLKKLQGSYLCVHYTHGNVVYHNTCTCIYARTCIYVAE